MTSYTRDDRYVCCDCEHGFEEPKKYSEDCTPGGAYEGGSFMRDYTGCPLCGGMFYEYEEYMESIGKHQCDSCEEWFSDDDMSEDLELCNDCNKEEE